MKVRVSFTVDVDDEFRKALGAYAWCNTEGDIATRAELKKWYEHNAMSMDESALVEYQDEKERPCDERNI